MVGLKDDVFNLDIIIATTDGIFLTTANIQKEDFSLVVFSGMQENEYMGFFEGIETSKDTISKLVKEVGDFPLVLATVTHFIKNYQERCGNIFSCSEDSHKVIMEVIDKHSKQKGKTINANAYDKSVLESQMAPLKYIKDTLKEDTWMVMKCLSFLQFDVISSIFLEAIYHY